MTDGERIFTAIKIDAKVITTHDPTMYITVTVSSSFSTRSCSALRIFSTVVVALTVVTFAAARASFDEPMGQNA